VEDPTPNQVFEKIGLMLCQLQGAEKAMSLCLTALRCESAATIEELTSLDGSHRRATLGQLIKKMSGTVSVEPSFATVLDRFLTKRNLFVHHRFLDADFHPVLSPEARRKALQFVDDLQTDYLIVKGVFMRYMCEIGALIDSEFAEQAPKLLSLLDDVYGETPANPLNVAFKKL
jgi:hypothetical protein